MNAEETLLEFPCKFPIKALGPNCADFDIHVIEIIRRHSPDISEGAVKSRLSHGGKYVSVTVTITAQSKRQLDAIYQDLSVSEAVLMAL
ncbi:MAG: YbeD family protein [Gammaproteobacteria bacterium]